MTKLAIAVGWCLVALALLLSLVSSPYYLLPLSLATVLVLVAATIGVGVVRFRRSCRAAAWTLVGGAILVGLNVVPRLPVTVSRASEWEHLRAFRADVCQAEVDWAQGTVSISRDVYHLEPEADASSDMPSFDVTVNGDRRGTVVWVDGEWVGGPSHITAVLNAPCQQRSIPPLH